MTQHESLELCLATSAPLSLEDMATEIEKRDSTKTIKVVEEYIKSFQR